MHNIRDILQEKGTTIWSTAPGDTVLDAISRMAEYGVGALLVIDDGQLVGFFSERDYTRKVILEGLASRDTPVEKVMSTPVISISPDATVQQGLSRMTEKHIRHLPVTDGSGVIGVVSIRDLVKAVIEDQQALIEQLERYITG
ncbi:MAG: CBS domain-containing protein, partial [Rhodospirillaceae bacterium]|nr:CBS domain-containing protein [Rhodospirillaceae bacterium]